MSNWKPVNSFITFTTKGITPKYVDRSSIIVLNQKCIRNNRIDFSFSQFSDSTKDIAETKFVKKGDILVNSTGTGTAGRCAFVQAIPMNHRLIVDSHILILRCHSYYEAQCLSYSLFSFEKTLMSFMTGSSGQSELDKVVLLNLKTKMPTDAITQQKIATVLSTLDAKIDINNRINAELESMAKTLYDYWFVQFDFPDKNGKPYKSTGGKMVWNEELKRKIPEGWNLGELGDVLSLEYGEPLKEDDRSGNGYPVLGSNGIVGYHKNFLVEGPGIVVGRKGTAGAVVWVEDSFYPIDTSFFVKDKLGLNDLFYHYFLLSRSGCKKVESSSAVPGLNRNIVYSVKVVVPEIGMIQKFNTIVAPLFSKTKLCNIETRMLSSLRDWLLPMLMNGQIKVN